MEDPFLKLLRQVFLGASLGAILCSLGRLFPDFPEGPTLGRVILVQWLLCFVASVSAGWYVWRARGVNSPTRTAAALVLICASGWTLLQLVVPYAYAYMMADFR